MFNVYALLLDDALKLATPLTNGAISETLTKIVCQFFGPPCISDTGGARASESLAAPMVFCVKAVRVRLVSDVTRRP